MSGDDKKDKRSIFENAGDQRVLKTEIKIEGLFKDLGLRTKMLRIKPSENWKFFNKINQR
ncbi:hypothetical protein DRP04_05940 [Archaeoglobales archaeon]|nr:MAG: hypothetical protein DRP04_05940 [Archaeoglobales archaeon]